MALPTARARDGDESDGEEGSGRGGYGDDPSSLSGGRLLRRVAPDGAEPTAGQVRMLGVDSGSSCESAGDDCIVSQG
jgi:hypothetical protein